jgi:hypothetical protein
VGQRAGTAFNLDRAARPGKVATGSYNLGVSRLRWVSLLGGLLLVVFAATAALHLSRTIPTLTYPTHSDQDDYLRWGREAATSGRLQSRAPLYSLWIAAVFLTTDGPLSRTQQVERTATLLILAAVTGWVASRFVGAYGGFLAGAWVLCSRYLVGEPNGSHTAAAVLWIAGVGVLTLSRGGLRPAAVFLLGMSTQIRSDMWFPTLVAILLLVRTDWQDSRLRNAKGWLWGASALVVSIGILAAFSHDLERTRINVLFRQSLAMTHLERTEGVPAHKLPWSEYETVWARLFPDTPDGWSLVRRRPEVLVQHIAYQARLSVRTLAADVFRPEYPWAFGVGVVVWLLLELGTGAHPPSRVGYDVIVTMLALVVLVPVSCLFRVAARNYLQLVPAAIILMMVAVQVGLSRFRSSGTESR